MLNNVKKGFAAARTADEVSKASRHRSTPILRPDEDTPVLFNGDPNEPLMVDCHTVAYRRKDGSEGFEKVYCSLEEDGQCDGCDRRAAGDNRVGAPTKHGAFSVVDLRWYGRVEADKPGQDGKPRYWYNPLPASVADPFGPKPDAVKFRKHKYSSEDIVRTKGSVLLLMSNRWTVGLGTTHESSARKCFSCGKGKISVEGYKIRGTKKVVPEPPKKEESDPVYACTKCDDPTPGGIFAGAPVSIHKTGEGPQTVYAFDIDPFAEMDMMKWVHDLKPIDLDEACAPTPKARYDALLGTGKQAKPGKKKEVEDDEDESDGEEEESLYNKSKSKESKSDGSDDEEEEEKPKKKKFKIRLG